MIDYQLTDVQALLIRHEGIRLFPYPDTATPPRMTIGVGRNLDDKGISEEEAIMLLNRDIADAIHAAQSCCSVYELLSRPRQLVLVSMAFNMGKLGLMGFVRFLNAIHKGDYEEAADEMIDSRWAKQVGPRAIELSRMMRNSAMTVKV